MDKNFAKILAMAEALADNNPEVQRLKSGRIGFIYMTVEDALGDLAGYLEYNPKSGFSYNGPPIPNHYVGYKTGGFMAAGLNELNE